MGCARRSGAPAVRMDLRVKLAVLVAMNAVLLLSTSLWVEVYLMAAALVLSVACGRPASAVRFGVTFIALVAVELAVVPALDGFVAGLVMFVAVLVRKILPVLCTGLLVFTTTEVSDFIAVATKFKLPQGVIIPLSVAFRYFPTLAQEWTNVRDAMRMRGIGMSFEHVVVPIMMSAVNVSDELSAAALCRGIDRPGGRTCLKDVSLSPIDWVVMAASAVSVLAIVCLKVQGVL